MVNIKTNNEANAVLLLTLPKQSARVHNKKSCCTKSSGKELIMAMTNVCNPIKMALMGFSYYFYFKACFFAGLFRRAMIPILSG